MSKRVILILNGGAALLLGWLYGGDAWDSIHSQTAEVAAYLEPPSLLFAGLALLGTAVGAGATLLGVGQRRDHTWRGYRLMPIVAVVVLFVDLFILTGSRSPLGTTDRTALTLRSFVDAAGAASTGGQVPRSREKLQGLIDSFGGPAYLLKGVPARAWKVEVREGCSGPVTERKAAPFGTVFYCLALDGRSAWVTVVALPVGTYFGPPAIFTRGGEVISGLVTPPPPEEPEPPVAEPELEAQVPDSGR